MRKLIPRIIAVVIFLSGLVNIASSFWVQSLFRTLWLERMFPMEISHASRTATILAGFCLLFLAQGVSQQKKRAWWLSVILLLVSVGLHLVKGFDFEESLALLIPLGLLGYYKNDFFVESGGLKTDTGLKKAGLILTMLFVYAVLGFFALSGQFSQPVTWQNIYRDYIFSILGVGNDILIPLTYRAIWFENSINVVGTVTLVMAFAAWFAPLLESGSLTEAEFDSVKNLVRNYSNNFTDYLTLMKDKKYFICRSRQVFLAYKVRNNLAVVLGGPIGKPDELETGFNEFRFYLKRKGLGLVLTNVKNYWRYRQWGFKSFKIGDEALIDIKSFDLSGAGLKNIRNAVSKIAREEIEFKWFSFDKIPWEIMAKVENLHRDWLSSRRGPALTFSVDFYPLPIEPEAFLLSGFDLAGKLVAAYSFLPFKKNQNRAYVLELMLRDQQAPNGIAEAMICQAIEFFRQREVEWLSLGMATKLFKKFNYFYGFDSLYKFKEKFNPKWEPCYLIYKGRSGLAKALLTVLQAHFG